MSADMPTTSAPASFVQHQGRIFRVLATFDEAEVDRANAWLEQNEGAALLCITNGTAFMAHVNDQGKPKRRMTCCCCAGFAGYFAQHWNRDDGYSVCKPCVTKQIEKDDADDIRMRYGLAGLNYEA